MKKQSKLLAVPKPQRPKMSLLADFLDRCEQAIISLNKWNKSPKKK